MSKLREAWDNYRAGRGWHYDVEVVVTETEADLAALRQSAETSAMVAEQAVEDLKAARAEIERLTRKRDEALEKDRLKSFQLNAALNDLEYIERECDEARNKALDEAANLQPDVASASTETRTAVLDWWVSILALKTKEPTNG